MCLGEDSYHYLQLTSLRIYKGRGTVLSLIRVMTYYPIGTKLLSERMVTFSAEPLVIYFPLKKMYLKVSSTKCRSFCFEPSLLILLIATKCFESSDCRMFYCQKTLTFSILRSYEHSYSQDRYIHSENIKCLLWDICRCNPDKMPSEELAYEWFVTNCSTFLAVFQGVAMVWAETTSNRVSEWGRVPQSTCQTGFSNSSEPGHRQCSRKKYTRSTWFCYTLFGLILHYILCFL